MTDKIIKISGSVIQHGKISDRIYLMKATDTVNTQFIEKLDNLAETQGYGKCFAKIKECSADLFVQKGFAVEASIPRFFADQEGCFFLGKFYNPRRKIEPKKSEYEKIVAISRAKETERETKFADSVKLLQEKDSGKIAELYRGVFTSYPFPIFDEGYIRKTMNENFVYFGCLNSKGELVAVASSEMDVSEGNAEMTDFAVLPQERGRDYALTILQKMEKEMKKRKIRLLFTIARADSYSMNITFAKAGYGFSGRLVNNTQIAGRIMSMNVWHKEI